jgi:fatty-acyl-CoA synthase
MSSRGSAIGLGRRAMLTPTREALYDATENRRFTYSELDERANRVGTYLIEKLGLQQGDAVSFLSRNRVEPIDLYFATGKIGLSLSPAELQARRPGAQSSPVANSPQSVLLRRALSISR